ncbi:hypothetical protein HY490_03860 [Candidatus Woesearchaeota archaeon]|nr:hypothetical protein [Candidatus Woesearchaeota archaeon]
MSSLQRRLQRTNKDQYTLTIPKQLVQLLGWSTKQKILFGFDRAKVTLSPLDTATSTSPGLVRILQRTPKDQFLLTIPKALVQLLGWKDKQEILFGFDKGKISLEATTPKQRSTNDEQPITGGEAHE